MSSRLATLIGSGAAVLWSLLGLLTAATGPVPPFQLLAMTFAVGGGVGALSWSWRRGAARALRQPARVWALGIAGLFGYHALYFAALKLAPPAEAGLINYLWPLLIVLFSAALPGETLRAQHVAGAVLGFGGVVALVAGRGGLELSGAYLAGYLCAFSCAFVWAGYSVLSRRVSEVSTDAVVGFCLATAALGLVCHLVFETSVWPPGPAAWAAVAAAASAPSGRPSTSGTSG
jgi:drug/metabolite transporter (DMT)-like permease